MFHSFSHCVRSLYHGLFCNVNEMLQSRIMYIQYIVNNLIFVSLKFIHLFCPCISRAFIASVKCNQQSLAYTLCRYFPLFSSVLFSSIFSSFLLLLLFLFVGSLLQITARAHTIIHHKQLQAYNAFILFLSLSNTSNGRANLFISFKYQFFCSFLYYFILPFLLCFVKPLANTIQDNY